MTSRRASPPPVRLRNDRDNYVTSLDIAAAPMVHSLQPSRRHGGNCAPRCPCEFALVRRAAPAGIAAAVAWMQIMALCRAVWCAKHTSAPHLPDALSEPAGLPGRGVERRSEATHTKATA